MKSTQKKKDLGIFYTPKEVVDLIISCSHSLKEHEDKLTARWDNHRPIAHFPSIIDPACGEGIFLKQAVSSGLTRRDFIFGADLDPSAVNNWESTSLLHEFEGDRSKLNVHFINQNGLLPIAWSAAQVKLLTHIKGDYIRKQQFDFVLGNPPYGGVGIADFDLPINVGLEKALSTFGVWQSKTKPLQQINLMGDMMPDIDIRAHKPTRQLLEKYPIEVLFIERFLQLAKDPSDDKEGGKIAIVLPEGIFANSTLDYVRKYITAHAKVLGIISLPRDTFKDTGTNAKTSILILEKTNKPVENSYPIFLASLTKNISENFAIISNSFKEWIMNATTKQIVDETNGLMIRVDKTITDLNSAKPASRWNTEYWHPKYDLLEDTLNKLNAKTLQELEGENCVISGDHVRKSRGESKGYELKTDIEYYETKGFLAGGYDYSLIKKCTQNAYLRLIPTKVIKKDILISCAGVGGVGKGKICIITHDPGKKSCTGDVFILRLKTINQYYAYVFLLGYFGINQILRQQSGTGTVNINVEQTLSLRIPVIKNQLNIESEYKKMSAFHDMAMEAKSKGDTSAYESNLKTAEDMLKDLVVKTEAVIRGEREDVV